MNLLVSACLLGLCTRYDGGHSLHQQVLQLGRYHTLIPVCPEQLGGLATPRLPCEISIGRVIRKDGEDLTQAFVKGAEAAIKICQLAGCKGAVLKSRSPSCGKGPIYDGSFTGQLTQSQGVLAQRLSQLSVPVYDETEAACLMSHTESTQDFPGDTR